MAGTLKAIAGPAYVANAAADIYTPPASTIYTVIRHIHLVNTDTAQRTVTLYKGATGGSAAGTEVLKDHVIAAKSEFDYYCAMVMKSTDFLSGVADAASKVVIIVEGEQIVVP